jgi:hypothetical protein
MDLPVIGSYIEVITDRTPSMKGFDWIIPRTHKHIGKVAKKQPWEKDNVFNLITDDPKMPIKSISMQYVKSIKDLNSNSNLEITKVVKTVDTVKTYEIPGSKGNSYLVTHSEHSWVCTCPAGGFGRHCKHVEAAKKIEATDDR